MTFSKFVKKINAINRSFDIGRLFDLNKIKDLKFNLDQSIDKNLCFKYSSYNIILIDEKTNSSDNDDDKLAISHTIAKRIEDYTPEGKTY